MVKAMETSNNAAKADMTTVGVRGRGLWTK